MHSTFSIELKFSSRKLFLMGHCERPSAMQFELNFKQKGSPHIHSFIWILNAPRLTKETKNDYIKWMNGIIREDLPSSNNEPELYDLVKNYQIHRHSKTCRKYKNQKCRFNFGKVFTDHTLLLNLYQVKCH